MDGLFHSARLPLCKVAGIGSCDSDMWLPSRSVQAGRFGNAGSATLPITFGIASIPMLPTRLGGSVMTFAKIGEFAQTPVLTKSLHSQTNQVICETILFG